VIKKALNAWLVEIGFWKNGGLKEVWLLDDTIEIYIPEYPHARSVIYYGDPELFAKIKELIND